MNCLGFFYSYTFTCAFMKKARYLDVYMKRTGITRVNTRWPEWFMKIVQSYPVSFSKTHRFQNRVKF